MASSLKDLEARLNTRRPAVVPTLPQTTPEPFTSPVLVEPDAATITRGLEFLKSTLSQLPSEQLGELVGAALGTLAERGDIRARSPNEIARLAIEAIIAVAEGGGPNAFDAAKYLIIAARAESDKCARERAFASK